MSKAKTKPGPAPPVFPPTVELCDHADWRVFEALDKPSRVQVAQNGPETRYAPLCGCGLHPVDPQAETTWHFGGSHWRTVCLVSVSNGFVPLG